MEIEYQKNLNHSYMVITDEKDLEADYQLRMMIENKIGGLLRCNIQKEDEKPQLYYEISSRYPLNVVYERKRMCYEEIQMFIKGIVKVVENLENYLLDSRHLLLDADYIYQNPLNKELEFCFYPGVLASIQNGLHKLAENILNWVDYKEERAVALAYELYRHTEEENHSVYELLDVLTTPLIKTELNETTKEISNEPDHMLMEEDEDSNSEEEGEFQGPFVEKLSLWTKRVSGGFIEKIKENLTRKKEEYEMEEAPISVIRESPGEYLERREMFQKVDAQRKTFPDPTYKENTDNTSSYGNTIYFNGNQHSGRLIAVLDNPYESFELNICPYIVGKLEDAVDIIISDACVSRIHARFDKEGECYYVTDLNSTNGTYVNQKELVANEACSLKKGDLIQFGNVAYRFE